MIEMLKRLEALTGRRVRTVLVAVYSWVWLWLSHTCCGTYVAATMGVRTRRRTRCLISSAVRAALHDSCVQYLVCVDTCCGMQARAAVASLACYLA